MKLATSVGQNIHTKMPQNWNEIIGKDGEKNDIGNTQLII